MDFSKLLFAVAVAGMVFVAPVAAEPPGPSTFSIVAADPKTGEVGVAVVVPESPDSVPTLEELRATGSQRLAHYKLPEAMLVVERLPLTDATKVDRRRLTEMVAP